MPAWRRAAWSWSRRCRKPGRLLRSEEPGWRPRRLSVRQRRRRRAAADGTAAGGAPRGARTRSPTRRTPPRRPGAAASTSPTPISPSAATHMVIGNFHGFNAYDIESPKKPRLLASVVCPGGQGDVSIYGNLLFMSVEQTRGRDRLRHAGRVRAVSKERFRGVRIFDITDISKPKQVAAVQTCRGSHTHTLVTDPKDKQNALCLRLRHGGVRSAEELAGCSGGDPKENPNTALFSIDVIEVPLGAPREGARSSTGRASSPTRRPAPSPACGRAATTAPARRRTQHDQPVPRHHGLPGGRPRRRRLLGQRHPDGHLAIRRTRSASIRRRQELRLLAFGDVQQRRHEGDLHRRMGRRHAAALPRRPICSTGAPTRSSTSSTAS